jgi:hypothetical protein
MATATEAVTGIATHTVMDPTTRTAMRRAIPLATAMEAVTGIATHPVMGMDPTTRTAMRRAIPLATAMEAVTGIATHPVMDPTTRTAIRRAIPLATRMQPAIRHIACSGSAPTIQRREPIWAMMGSGTPVRDAAGPVTPAGPPFTARAATTTRLPVKGCLVET